MRRALRAAVFAMLLASPASADETGPSLADSLTGLAKADYVAARTLYNDGDYGAALVKFQSALDTSKEPRLLWNIAACERGLRHYAQAIRYVERYKTEAASKLNDQDQAEADTLISGLRPYVAALSVHANVDGASVALDDHEVGATPLDRALVDLGTHHLVVKKPGYVDYSADLTITGNAELVRDVRLDPEAHEGKLAVHTGAGDSIAIDGKSVGIGEFEATLPSGEHVVRVTGQGKKPYEVRVMVADGQLRSVDVTLEKEGANTLLPLWAWIGLGAVAVTGVSLATYFALKPKSEDTTQPVNGTIPPGTVQLPGFRFH